MLGRSALLAAGGSGGVKWTPAQITTQIWLDADDASTITLTGGFISQWNDKSGNNRHATQSTAASRPTLTSGDLNGRNVVTFDGVDDWLTAGTAANWSFLNASNATAEVVAVWKPGVVSNPNAIYCLYNTNNGTVFNIGTYIAFDDRASVPRNDAAVFVCRAGATHVVSAVSNILLPNTTSILDGRINLGSSPASNRFSQYINGAFFAGNNTEAGAIATGTPANALHIGRFTSTLGYLNGHIAELIITSSLFDTSTRQKVEGYLAYKWGIALPAGHPYTSKPPFV